MKLAAKVKDALLASVAAHWEAVEHYTAQAAHLRACGYSDGLIEAVGADPADEFTHLNRLLARLEFFDESTDAPEPPESTWPRHDLPGILAFNLDLEETAAEIERDGYAAALAAGDPGTAEVFAENLKGSESGVLTIKATQRKVADQTLPNFLSAFNA